MTVTLFRGLLNSSSAGPLASSSSSSEGGRSSSESLGEGLSSLLLLSRLREEARTWMIPGGRVFGWATGSIGETGSFLGEDELFFFWKAAWKWCLNWRSALTWPVPKSMGFPEN